MAALCDTFFQFLYSYCGEIYYTMKELGNKFSKFLGNRWFKINNMTHTHSTECSERRNWCTVFTGKTFAFHWHAIPPPLAILQSCNIAKGRGITILCVFKKERSMLKYKISNTITIIQIYSRQLLHIYHYLMWHTNCWKVYGDAKKLREAKPAILYFNDPSSNGTFHGLNWFCLNWHKFTTQCHYTLYSTKHTHVYHLTIIMYKITWFKVVHF